MTFPEIIHVLSQIDKQPGIKFERIVLILLQKYYYDRKIELVTNLNTGISIDYNGLVKNIDTSEHPETIIAIKFNKRLPILRHLIYSYLDKSRQYHKSHDILIVVSFQFTKEEKERIIVEAGVRYPNLKLSLWDVNDLTPIFNKYAEFVSDLIPQAREKAFKNIVSKSIEDKDWKKGRENIINKLNEAFRGDDLAIFLGAGISVSAGLPDWNSLLSQLFVSLISKSLPKEFEVKEEDKLIIANSLKELNILSPLLEARYVNSGLGEAFEDEVSKVLYKGITKDAGSDLINSIANLCIPRRGALGVKAVVTYNFDNLLENALQKLNLRYRTIYRDVDTPSKEELGIFHVHGFLPNNSVSYDGISESLLVFSEKNYHTLMQDPYFWSNLIQLNFFRENTCLLIGLSGTDPNLRRLLEISKRKTKFAKHYILLPRTPNSFFIENFEKQSTAAYNNELIDTINSIHHHLHEKSFDELGLNIVWYDDHKEIPILLSLINNKNQMA